MNFLLVPEMTRPDQSFVPENILMAAGDDDGYKLRVQQIMVAVKKGLQRESGLTEEGSKQNFFNACAPEVVQEPAGEHRRRFSNRQVLKQTLQQSSSAATTHCSSAFVVRLVVFFYCFYLFPL